jgi:hypothetical protein
MVALDPDDHLVQVLVSLFDVLDNLCLEVSMALLFPSPPLFSYFKFSKVLLVLSDFHVQVMVQHVVAVLFLVGMLNCGRYR